MDLAPATEILIVTQEAATASRWAAILGDPQSRIWLAVDDVPDPARLELILTDQNAHPVSPAGAAEKRLFGDGEAGPTRPAVIRIGGRGPADVRLPADATERELRLACRLLAEVVRLRRKDHGLAQSQRRLAEEALTDPLTGLPNRRAWDRALQERIDNTGGSAGRLCLAIIDLDHFKRVNDRHGHVVGDEVLRATGKVISGGLRESDFVARLGGDEFGLLLTVRDEATARAVVDRVRGSLPSGLARHGTRPITASAGYHLASSGETGSPLRCSDAVYMAADTALAEAKRQGRDRTVGGRVKDEG